MMSAPRLRCLLFAALGAYTAALVACELLGAREVARHLCTDIVGPIRFYAVNTTLSVGLLVGAALLCWFAAAVVLAPLSSVAAVARERRFLALQGAVFCYLGLDDRFLLHETIGERLGIHDASVLLVVGVCELLLLWRLGDLRARTARARRCLAWAAGWFAVMTVFDCVQQAASALPRLTLEDGAKTWSAACLFAFAWELAAQAVRRVAVTPHALLGAARSAGVPDAVLVESAP